MRINIALLIRSLDYGGAQRSLVTLAKALDPARFRVTVLHFYRGGDFVDELRRSNIETISLDKRGRWDLAGFSLGLLRELRRVRPAVLHSFLVEPNLLALLLKPFFPKTRIIWGVRASYVPIGEYDLFTRSNFRLQSLLSRFADLIIFNSEAGRAFHLALGFPKARSIVIHNGIDTTLFKPDREAGRKLRAELGIPGDAPVIGLVGRLDPLKDHPNFLRAAALVSEQRADVRFLLVGDGPQAYAQQLKRSARELGLEEKITWTGARADMTAVYNAHDLLASSSYGEGFPNVVGEAMACGVPCVGTDVGDTALIIGDAGRIVPPRDAQALAAALLSCLESDAAALGQKARARIEGNYSLERMVERMTQALLSRHTAQ